MPRRRTVGWIAGGVLGLVLVGLIFSIAHRSPSEATPRPSSKTARETAASSDSTAADEPVAIIKPAPRPTGPLPENVTCATAECHGDMKSAPHIHGPVATNNCLACHSADIGGHRYPLKANASDTCKFCHTVTGTMQHQHKALDKGCITCHQPHVANVKYLLRQDSEADLCKTCHKIEVQEYQHEPFGKGDCSACHMPHQSNLKFLLKGADGSSQCARCHEATVRAAADVKFPHKPATENCVNCHSPHSSNAKHQLKAAASALCSNCHPQVMAQVKKASFKHDPVVTGSECANCHNPHGSNNRPMLTDRQDKLCLKCHADAVVTRDGRQIPGMAVELTKSKFLHGPIRAGECSPCHDAHASDHKLLLRSEFPRAFYTPFSVDQYQLCFSCHTKDLVLTEETEHLTAFREGTKNMHFLHVNRDPKGRSCKSCHAIHGSNQPNHIAQKVQFDGSDWAMEINYAPTATGGSCQPGCHSKRDYDRTHVTIATTRPAATTQPSPTTQTAPTTLPTGGPP